MTGKTRSSPAAETAPALSIVVDTPNGAYVRNVAHAIPLPAGVVPGSGAEEATQAAATLWGLPDFVYRPVVVRVGSGTRELGDRILLVGDLAVVVQVKSRQGGTGDRDREESWARKAAAQARRQARGTIRRLLTSPATLQNGRGREIKVDGTAYQWLTTVVLDHNEAPEGLVLDHDEADPPYVVLLRRDWDFLFDQLRSTHAVVHYLNRVATMEVIPLGEEPVRYYELAAADLAATGTPVDQRFLGKSGFQSSVPLLPQAPAGRDNRRANRLLRIILEDIATSSLPSERVESDRLRVLANIDSLPVADRTSLGERIFDMLEKVARAQEDQVSWQFRRFVFPKKPLQLGFGACTRFGEHIQGAFNYWVTLRHHEMGERLGSAKNLMTVGVLLTPRHDGLRPWDTTLSACQGESGLTAEDVAALQDLWSVWD